MWIVVKDTLINFYYAREVKLIEPDEGQLFISIKIIQGDEYRYFFETRSEAEKIYENILHFLSNIGSRNG